MKNCIITFSSWLLQPLQVIGEKRPAPIDPTKKPKTPKKKKKKDPNEPQKPVSAYALFFRDTQAAIKGQNPNATFGEVSKIVASMWDGLGEEQKQVLEMIFRMGFQWQIQRKLAHRTLHCLSPPLKISNSYAFVSSQVYKSKTEAAKKEYLKALAAYRASLVSKVRNLLNRTAVSKWNILRPTVYFWAAEMRFWNEVYMFVSLSGCSRVSWGPDYPLSTADPGLH